MSSVYLGKERLREIILRSYKGMFDKAPASEDDLLAFALALFFINSNAAGYIAQGITDAGLVSHFLADPPRKDLTNLDCFRLFREGLKMYEAIYQAALMNQEVKRATEALHKELLEQKG